MNTIRSTWIGWGVLIVAGGGSYYFAKREVNKSKQARQEEELKRRRIQQSLEFNAPPPVPRKREKQKSQDHSGNPSAEASQDPAPISHPPETERQHTEERGKYEPSVPYRARKGDRL